MASLTAKNSTVTIIVNGLYDGGFTLKGYSVDDMFSMEDLETAQSELGADGFIAFGYLPTTKKLRFMLMAASPSIDNFVQWRQGEAKNQGGEFFECSVTITVPSRGVQHVFSGGCMTRTFGLASHGRMQKPVTIELTFEDMVTSPTGTDANATTLSNVPNDFSSLTNG